jgi:hypothetical protein
MHNAEITAKYSVFKKKNAPELSLRGLLFCFEML